jgi:hypothetical protein
MALEQYSFGVGNIYLLPLGVTAPTPVQVGTTQGATVGLDWSDKPLQGQFDAPSAIARGALKLSGKITAANFRARDLASTIFGGTATAGTTLAVNNEGGATGLPIGTATTLNTSTSTSTGSTLTFTSTTGVAIGQSVSGTNIAPGTTVIAPLTTTTVTLSAALSGTVASGAPIVFGSAGVTVANAATFVDDLGVVNATTGAQMTRVVSAPTTGQYAVNAGTYTFSSADAAAGVKVLPSYTYTQLTAGSGFTYFKQQMGFRPTFKLVLGKMNFTNNPNYKGIDTSLTLWSVGINKFSFDGKNEDWTVPESDWSASSDFLGRVFTWGSDQ